MTTPGLYIVASLHPFQEDSDVSYIDELMSAALQAFGMWLVTSERVANFGHVHRCISIWQDLRFQRLLRSMVLPEMPVAPPESDYGDDSIEHLEQLRQNQGRDTFVSACASSRSLSEAG